MELNNLPLQLSIEDFMEDGNMIQLNIGVSKEGSVVMRKQWCVTFATMQLLVSSYFLYLLFVRWDDSKSSFIEFTLSDYLKKKPDNK